jgi:hypothetical protein
MALGSISATGAPRNILSPQKEDILQLAADTSTAAVRRHECADLRSPNKFTPITEHHADEVKSGAFSSR